MEKVTFKNLIYHTKCTFDELRKLYSMDGPSTNKRQLQSNRIRIQFLKKKLRDQMGRLNQLVHGTIIKATYQLKFQTPEGGFEVKKFEQTFVNLNQQEVWDILHLMADWYRAYIVILELRESQTHIREL